jgi:hypothetical protein
LANQQGYFSGAHYYNQTTGGSNIVIVKLSPDGMLIYNIPVGFVKYVSSDYHIQQVRGGYLLRYVDDWKANSSTVVVKINNEGKVIGTQSNSSIFIPTKDDGILSIGIPVFITTETDVKKTIEIKKIDGSGQIQWINAENCSVENLFSYNIKPPSCATNPPLGDGAHCDEMVLVNGKL